MTRESKQYRGIIHVSGDGASAARLLRDGGAFVQTKYEHLLSNNKIQ